MGTPWKPLNLPCVDYLKLHLPHQNENFGVAIDEQSHSSMFAICFAGLVAAQLLTMLVPPNPQRPQKIEVPALENFLAKYLSLQSIMWETHFIAPGLPEGISEYSPSSESLPPNHWIGKTGSEPPVVASGVKLFKIFLSARLLYQHLAISTGFSIDPSIFLLPVGCDLSTKMTPVFQAPPKLHQHRPPNSNNACFHQGHVQFNIPGTVWHTPVEKRKKREEGRQAPEPQPEPRRTSKSWWNRTPFLRKERREKKGDKHRNQRREKKGDKHRNPSRNQEEPANHEGTKAVSSKNWEPHSAQELFGEKSS